MLIEAVVKSPSFDKLGKHTNDKGETPLHTAAKPHLKSAVSKTVLSCLLQTNIVDPSARDKNGKRACDYIKDNDRVKLLENAMACFNPETKKSKKKKKKKSSRGEKDKNEHANKNPSAKSAVVPPACDADTVPVPKIDPKPSPKKEVSYKDLSSAQKMVHHLLRLKKMDAAYFQVLEDEDSSFQKLTVYNSPSRFSRGTQSKQSSPRTPIVPAKTSSSAKSSPSVINGLAVVGVPLSKSASPGEFSLEGLNFDSLPWEVEVTRNVVKFFKNTKKYSSKDRVRAAAVIYSIAEGKRNMHLAKRVGSSEKVCLYEARITDAGRILWEKAINFSQKLTQDPNFPLYTQVVRVWEVILDHDDLDRRIKYCTDQIITSYDRGYLSSVRWGLRHLSHLNAHDNESVRGQEKLDLPFMYTKDSALIKPEHHFVPAASTNESEYSVTTFYSFDTVSVKSMISGSNEKRDYPFKEWQKEHEIIKINSTQEAILLLGRSGTGKTTCCLYRLWNEFKNYWNPDSQTFGVKIPRKTLISVSLGTSTIEPGALPLVTSEIEPDSKESDDDVFGVDAYYEEDDMESPLPSCVSNAAQGSTASITAQGSSAITHGSTASVASVVVKGSHPSSSSGCGFVVSDQIMGVIEEDLHQVFVTKNYVLCDQMRKRFFCMVAGCDFLEPHLEYEGETPPNSLSKYDDLSFPAFLTARQFYILLDNSLGDNDTFFKRDSDGNLQVKISSLDYDHEDSDILLDLEQSDSEDDDMEMMRQYSSSTPLQTTPRQHAVKWTEVTALYFKEIIWPKISHDFGKEFDPMLVWLEIQSFIKGSEFAVEKGAPLSFTEYTEVGNRMAPNFSSHRNVIYKLYMKYCQFVRRSRHSIYLFDECDLVLDLYNRLKKTGDVPWSIHSVYIDEVQDFTQAELAVFIHCCRDPNSMFFTGDTAQNIMRGIAFRFQDLRSCFHRIHTQVPYIGVPEKPYKLTTNYRSHSGILKLAGSVIDLISEFFKDSIDHLPDDEGMFPGPMPVFLDSCEVKDLSLLLSTNERECSAIEFGAHQVILVQSKDAKDKLPDILKGAISLTIFEAKGLEFDDVLLYNFFTDSLVDEKGWRVISSYLEKLQHEDKIENKKPLPGHSTDPRSVVFNPTLHKSLNAELKYLYTAITRAKCNLWIYDSNKKNRLPMLAYWHKRDAVKIVSAADGGTKQNYSLVFASNSTPEQWAAQGDNFRKRHLWEQAILCYEKAGVEYAYLAKEACAYHFIQEARQQKPHLFQTAALNFMERDELKHSVHCINGAALCLKNSRPPKHLEAAKLFEQLGDLSKAAQCFLRGRDFDSFARIQENLGEYNSVIRSLLGKPFMKKREALMKAAEYEKKGCMLDPKFTPSELSFSCAKFYSGRKDKKVLLEVLKYMPEHERRVKFLKEAELFKEAFDDHTANNQYSSAYRLASARGWFADGKALAKQSSDTSMEARFILQEAKQEYLMLPVNFNVSSVNPDTINRLKEVASSKETVLKAEANLLLGMLLKAQSQCIVALGQFKMQKHKAGTLEAFEGVGQYSKVSDQEVLDCSHIAKKVSTSLRESNDMNLDVKLAVKLCGLQLIGKVYFTSPFSNIWIDKDTLLKYEGEDADPDGMLCLKHDVRDVMAKHYEAFIEKWLAKFKLETKLQQRLQAFKLHPQLLQKRSLNRQYSLQEVSSLSLREYLQACVHFLELWVLKDQPKRIDSCIAHILAIFSPQVYIYLPQCLNSQHVHTVRISVNSRKCFADFIQNEISRSSEVVDRVQMNDWLHVWRASCIALPSLKLLTEKINGLESDIGKKAEEDKDYKPPPGYIFWKSENRYCHIFSLWLNSCVDLREHSRVLWAAKLAITHFLGNIAEDQRIFISVMNCVDILSVHCTSLLAMITNANALQNISTAFTLPLMYKHVVDFFNCMNCRRARETSDKTLLAACVEQVSSYRNLHDLFSQCKQLLVRAMGYLIGTHSRAPRFSLLKFGLNKFPESDATRLCLILTLTLFGNLTMLKVRDLRLFEDKISGILKKAATRSAKVPGYIRKVYSEVSANSQSFSRPAFVFNLVANLLHNARMDNTLSKLIFRQKANSQGHIEFVNYQPQVRKPPPTGGHFVPSENLPEAKIAESLSQMPIFPPSEKLPVPASKPHPPASELGTDQTVSPVTAPIGSERRQAASSSALHSGDPLPIKPPIASTLNPNASSYLPGLPNTVANPLPGLPTAAANSSLAPPTPAFHEGTMYYPMSSSDSYTPVDSNNFFPAGATAPHNPNVAAASVGQVNLQEYSTSVDGNSFLPAGAAPQYPNAAVGQINLQEYQSNAGLVPPDMFLLQQPPAEYTYSDTVWYDAMYHFQDEAFSYAGLEQQDEMEGYVEYEENFGLTQPIQPLLPIDPTMIEEDIIDAANNFCNVCGITYQMDEVIEAEDYHPDRPAIESFLGHVCGRAHHENTVSYKRFKLLVGELADGSEAFTVVQLAEQKLKECKDLKAEIETEQLDQVIDDLQDKIHKYHEAVYEFEDSRRWSEGTAKISSMNETVARLLKSATDQAHKLAEVSRQRFVRKLDEEDELNEMDAFSAHFEKDLDHDVLLKGPRDGKRGDGKIRTAEEKRQSRDKKRSKKQK